YARYFCPQPRSYAPVVSTKCTRVTNEIAINFVHTHEEQLSCLKPPFKKSIATPSGASSSAAWRSPCCSVPVTFSSLDPFICSRRRSAHPAPEARSAAARSLHGILARTLGEDTAQDAHAWRNVISALLNWCKWPR